MPTLSGASDWEPVYARFCEIRSLDLDLAERISADYRRMCKDPDFAATPNHKLMELAINYHDVGEARHDFLGAIKEYDEAIKAQDLLEGLK